MAFGFCEHGRPLESVCGECLDYRKPNGHLATCNCSECGPMPSIGPATGEADSQADRTARVLAARDSKANWNPVALVLWVLAGVGLVKVVLLLFRALFF